MMVNGIYVARQSALIKKMNVLQGKKLPVTSLLLRIAVYTCCQPPFAASLGGGVVMYP